MRSNPSCMCRAIMGKLFSRSLKDLISFLSLEVDLSSPALDTPFPFDESRLPCILWLMAGRMAGGVLIGSGDPTSGLEM